MTNTTGIVTAGHPIEAASIRLVPSGTIVWYSGNISAAGDVSGFLICNGAGYSSSIYGRLYAAIGTTYGSGDGTSTDFNVPDLTGLTPDETDIYGYFIRATDGLTGSKSVGIKEHNTIRNIKGRLYAVQFASSTSGEGPFSLTAGNNTSGRDGSWSKWQYVDFDSNLDTGSYGNPMAGHTADNYTSETQDTHPSTIFMIPLIAY